MGYSFVPYWRKKGTFIPGIAYKKDLYEKVAQKMIDCSLRLEKEFNGLRKRGFIMLLLLQSKKEPEKKLVVGTVHLHADPRFDNVK